MKGSLATLLPTLFHVDINPLWFGLVAVVGHTLPVFAGFKGGTRSTSAGMLLAFAPLFFCYSLAFFLIVLYITSMVSAASIASAFCHSHRSYCRLSGRQSYRRLTFADGHLFCLDLLHCYRHRENIRIKAGNENRVSFGEQRRNKENNS
ncbi:MAG: glycerol-3-phosphate acyltransferase [Enterococcus sp.]|uniref:glycerol-3-phosphate acyltransferase n=1 Tax=Enterococcus sp. TaxID=35783 RepID=UPI0039960B7B